MLGTVSLFHSDLIFVGQAGAYTRETSCGTALLREQAPSLARKYSDYDKLSSFLRLDLMIAIKIVLYTPRAVFTTLYVIRNTRIGPIS